MSQAQYCLCCTCPPVATSTSIHNITGGYTHHRRAHGRGHTPKIELTDGSIAVSSEILESFEGDQCWPNHVVHTNDAEKTLIFKTFKGFKEQLACERAINQQE
jgi:hypothetical protein